MYVRVSVILHANFSFYGWKAIAPYTLYSMGNSSLVIFKTIDLKGGLDNSQSHCANMLRVDDPRSEPRVLHELTQNKMAEDAESDIAIRLVDENDYREISAKVVSAKR